MAHLINIFIDESDTDCRVLKIRDISEYDSRLEITNPVIKIEMPGIDCPFYPVFAIKSDNYYTSNTFSITCVNCACDLIALPDGVYTITFSVCPNEEVFTKIYFLRDCVTRNKLLCQLGSLLNLVPTDSYYDVYGNDDHQKLIDDISDMLDILDSAKADILNLKFKQAEEKMAYINKKLNKCC